MIALRSSLLPLIAVILILVAVSCDVTSPPNPNRPPITRLTNIPKDNDTIFPLASLSWLGGDYDGFVQSYQYRSITYHLLAGSTTQWMPFDSTGWRDTSGTTVTIAFNSSDPINRQVFVVRAIDNDGQPDANPATRTLYTTRAAPPKTTIDSPKMRDTVLILDRPTDWWAGMTLRFHAVDQTAGGEIAQYAWSVDDGPWTWGAKDSVAILPSAFAQPTTGVHKIKVTSRNNTNLVDPVGDSVLVELLHPPFDRQVLVIDETDEFNVPFVTYQISDATVDAFYAEVFPGSDSWDFKANGMPPRQLMARYKLVVWHADDIPVSVPHKISDPNSIAIFTDYLQVGGKFVMSGWRILKSFAYQNNFPYTFQAGSFVYDYLHIRGVTETDLLGDCIGGIGKQGSFSDFAVDSARLAFFPYSGKLAQVNLITSMAGFTDILYTYTNKSNSSYVQYRGRAIALRYYGTAYDAAVFGFPMYFVKKEDAKVMAQELMQSLHVN